MSSADVKKIIYSSDDIQLKTKELAEKISEDYFDKPLTLICILKGAYVFCSDLSRYITIPHTVEFMSVSSYSDTESTGTVKILTDLRCSIPIQDRHVIVVEDILDTGLTLNHLCKLLRTRKPASLECCALLTKPTQLRNDVKLKYSGFDLNPPEFVVGYGLDYNEVFRNLPFIGVPTNEAIEKYRV